MLVKRWLLVFGAIVLTGSVSLVSYYHFRGVVRPSALRSEPDVKQSGTVRQQTFISLNVPPMRGPIESELDESWTSESVSEKASEWLLELADHVQGRGMAVSGRPLDSSVNFITPGEKWSEQSVGDYRIFRLQSSDGSVRRTTVRSDMGLFEQLHRGLDVQTTIRQVRFKVVGVREIDSERVVETDVRAEIGLSSDERTAQTVSQWRCRWLLSDNDGLRLKEIEVRKTEHVAREGAPLFVDVTSAVLGKNSCYESQVIPGLSYWSQRLTGEFVGQIGHHGIAVGDVNGDGLDDLYVCDAAGLPNRLYLHHKDGTATDCSADSGVDFLDDSSSALFIDLDNDGDQDLVVATASWLRMAKNEGNGKFALVTSIDIDTDCLSLAAADFDSDGDVDIYACGYDRQHDGATARELPFPIPYDNANNGGRNVLLRNEGSFRFADATEQAGLDENNSRFSMAVAWEDFDRDGDLDLYVANDFGPNNLFQNENGRFRDVADTAGVQDHASGMSVTWGDFNRDGWPDLYVGNMFSSAGNRVSYQRRFAAGADSQTIQRLRRMARGNTLFENQGDGTFRDVSVEKNITMGRWSWASEFLDFTNDGWLDVVITNGYITNEDSHDL